LPPGVTTAPLPAIVRPAQTIAPQVILDIIFATTTADPDRDPALPPELPVVQLSELEGSVIDENVLIAIAESGTDVVVELSSGLRFTIIANSIDVDKVVAFDLDIEVDATDRAEVINGARMPGNSIVLQPNFSGEFGFEIEFTFTAEQLAEQGIKGNNISLFHVDYDGKVTDMGRVRLNNDGSVNFTISHASFYILSEESPVGSDETRFRLGDVNGDDVIDIRDAIQILRYLAGMTNIIDNSTLAAAAATIASQDEPAIGDVVQILRYLAGMSNQID
jgi:hypothetical protein